MKTRILSILAAVAAFLTMLGGLDLSGIVSVLPQEVAVAFATALPLLAGIVHLIKAVGDFFDDGEINGSFRCSALMCVLALVVSLMATSCTNPVPWYVSTPYGDARGDAKGGVTITPNIGPIVIPDQSGK